MTAIITQSPLPFHVIYRNSIEMDKFGEKAFF